jgi:DNA-binding transcriptional regulator GbsR (MarR family)
MSLKSIAEELHVSKPAVSTTINYGLQSGIIKKVYIKEYPRESFFEIKSDLMKTMLEPGLRKLSVMSDKLNKAAEMLERMPGGDEAEVEDLNKRISYMRRSFEILLEEYEKFEKRCIERLDEIKPNNY